MPGADRLYATRPVAWAVPSADWCSQTAAIAYPRIPFQVDSKAFDTHLASPSGLDVYDTVLDADGK